MVATSFPGSCKCQRALQRKHFGLRSQFPRIQGLDSCSSWLGRRRWMHSSISAVADAESPLVAAEADKSSPAAIRKYLASVGWQSAWIDGITERLMRKQLVTTSDRCQAVVEYLMTTGLTEAQICNMVSLCMEILECEVEVLKPVIEYLKKQGVTDIPALLLMNPKLLSYSRSANGKVLERGSMRAAVVSTPPGDLASVRIAIYREGTTFGTSPISPWKPKGL